MNDVALTPQATKELFIKMVVDAWNASTNQVTKIFDDLTDDQLKAEAAPGRNTGVYLLGHLTAVTDRMLPLLGFGERSYPQLDKPFLATPDKSGLEIPSIQELKQYWKEVNAKLSAAIAATEPDEWFNKHTSVSAEDFAKEPNRNKLNVLMNRTNHQSTHYGQLIYLKPKN
ncbi:MULTISPECIES: DinB family protein [Niastella]|uniref:DinB family protein n=1 Tax=Niastella soli TaxID=2821487 RepID=A0ABS3YN81_9BACT|nr:DinB family protein [Niastella soli]MBO9199337.1 DinB family protein [Niastella soli]